MRLVSRSECLRKTVREAPRVGPQLVKRERAVCQRVGCDEVRRLKRWCCGAVQELCKGEICRNVNLSGRFVRLHSGGIARRLRRCTITPTASSSEDTRPQRPPEGHQAGAQRRKQKASLSYSHDIQALCGTLLVSPPLCRHLPASSQSISAILFRAIPSAG